MVQILIEAVDVDKLRTASAGAGSDQVPSPLRQADSAFLLVLNLVL